jgi:hypothetical protein
MALVLPAESKLTRVPEARSPDLRLPERLKGNGQG